MSTPHDLKTAVLLFEYQDLNYEQIAAVLECTQLSFLPERWRTKVAEPNGRSQLQERLVAIRQLMEE